MTTKQYKSFKGLKKESLRGNMTNMEIALNMLAEASATELSKQRNPNGFHQQKQVAKDGVAWRKPHTQFAGKIMDKGTMIYLLK